MEFLCFPPREKREKEGKEKQDGSEENSLVENFPEISFYIYSSGIKQKVTWEKKPTGFLYQKKQQDGNII